MSQLILKHPDFQPENVKFDTVEVHAGEPRDTYGSLIPPIYQTSTFYFASTDDAVEACGDYAENFAYSRITNPSLDYMEQKLAALEHGKGAVSYASGMGAVAGALFAALKCGDHVIFTKAKYSGTQDITSDWLPRFGIEHDSFQADHLEELEPLIKPNTKVIYVETPANPTMVLVDLEEVAKIARWLEADPHIETVRYPFLESNPQYDIAKKQMQGGGGMISFDVKGGLEAGKKFINSLKLCTLAVSLGDTETLVEQAAAMTHTMIPKEVREAAGITDGMIRMSVGLEDPDDIIADLDQALSR